MKSVNMAIIAMFVPWAPALASAQLVPGNEAVQVMVDGTKRVRTPPTRGALPAKACPASNPACLGGRWKMAETADRLIECAEIHACPDTRRPSGFGTRRLSRTWAVEVRSQWPQGTQAELRSRRVAIARPAAPDVQ